MFQTNGLGVSCFTVKRGFKHTHLPLLLRRTSRTDALTPRTTAPAGPRRDPRGMRSTRGYYGQLYSGDDFYALSSGLTVQETTNSSLETETGLGFGACSGLVVVFTIRLGGMVLNWRLVSYCVRTSFVLFSYLVNCEDVYESMKRDGQDGCRWYQMVVTRSFCLGR